MPKVKKSKTILELAEICGQIRYYKSLESINYTLLFIRNNFWENFGPFDDKNSVAAWKFRQSSRKTIGLKKDFDFLWSSRDQKRMKSESPTWLKYKILRLECQN